MLNIDEKFFEGEERNGYYIESVMKRAWAAQMEMLDDIRIVCEKHDIKWFVDWGTLLGTIRHGGFVPWDDDVDISMLRPDLNKFLEVAEQELGGSFDRNGNLKKQVLELATKLFSMYGEEDADEVAMIPFTTRIKGRTQHPKWCYSDVEWRDFEGVMKVPVPIGWDEILRSKYGDYNEVKMYHPHGDFPFSNGSRRILRRLWKNTPRFGQMWRS